jgi:cytochrome b pre-mRNA-processing protein 3
MIKLTKQKNSKVDLIYNKILLLSRDKIFYTKFNLIDTFDNRINLIFIHACFLFNKAKRNNKSEEYKFFYQETFDFIFEKIELNMREIGYGDVTINKNMRFLVKNFYHVLLTCEKYKEMSINQKDVFLKKQLKESKLENKSHNKGLIEYFDKYEAFCFDLSSDSVLKGELNFNFN